VFAPFTTTAKEEILSPFPLCCADPALASCLVNLEKPHQGVAGKNPALHPGIEWSNSTSALGLRTLAVENRVGSRCTGKERDTESGLDMFGARYYGSSLGRFMTPDWAAKPTNVPYASFGNPQSLNLYSYVNNNPTTTRDPDGHCAEVLSCTIEFGAGGSVFGPVGTAIGATIGAGVGLFVTYEVVKAVSSTIHQSDSNTAPAPGTTEQGRDAQGRFLPKEPGQTQPGAQTEKETLAAEGATKNTAPLPGTNRIPDGTVDATGQKIEVKSGQSVSNTGQLVQAGQAAQAATGQPLLVVTTNPNVHVSAPAQQNPNLQIRPAKQDPPSQ
jgi:RHS repeat-associated protein